MLVDEKKAKRTKRFFLFRSVWTTASKNIPNHLYTKILHLDNKKSKNEDIQELLEEIEKMREELTELVSKKGFTSSDVVELSQRLDKYIVEAQRKLKLRDSVNLLKNSQASQSE